MPRLSIVTALFNKEAYIADTIRSVLQQTIRDWEMIVVDNGSTDRGASIARQFADPRIRVIECLKRGPGAARNVGISAATGDWIQFLDADDLLAKTHLSELLACGEKTRCDLVVGRWRRFIDSPSNLLAEEKPAGEGQNRQDLVDYAIAFAPWAVHAPLLRRSVLSNTAWPEHLDRYLGEDIAFWFRLLSQQVRLEYSRNAGALYRWKPAYCRTDNEDPDKWFTGLHNAAMENLSFLKGHNVAPTAKQCEYLMRLYEGIYSLARQKHNNPVARQTSQLTKKWLSRSLSLSRYRFPLVVRRIVGLRLYCFLKRCRLSRAYGT